MAITLTTTGKIGKGLTIKREKAADDTEQTFAHLKLADCFVTRREIDLVCDQDDGWSGGFFDDMGAPRGAWSLVLHKVAFTATGGVHGPTEREKIEVANATLDGLEITFTKLGGLLSGTLTWLVAGDEAGDAEPLLGRECRVALVLEDGGQRDMLKEKAA